MSGVGISVSRDCPAEFHKVYVLPLLTNGLGTRCPLSTIIVKYLDFARIVTAFLKTFPLKMSLCSALNSYPVLILCIPYDIPFADSYSSANAPPTDSSPISYHLLVKANGTILMSCDRSILFVKSIVSSWYRSLRSSMVISFVARSKRMCRPKILQKESK